MKENQRNKSRAPGMTLLGVPMHNELKSRIQTAAKIERRTMADWARLELEKAAFRAACFAASINETPEPSRIRAASMACNANVAGIIAPRTPLPCDALNFPANLLAASSLVNDLR